MSRRYALGFLVLSLAACASGPRAEFDGSGIHYTDVGSGSTAMVFVHGWASDRSFWSEQIPALADIGRLIAIDLPGHGQSDKPNRTYTMAYWADSVAAVMRQTGVDRAVLVGHSNGVPVIRQFYRQFPSKVLALIAVDGALAQVATLEQAKPYLDRLASPGYLEFARGLTREMVKRGKLTQPQKSHIEAVAVATPQRVMIDGMKAALDPAVWRLDPIHVPVLMINAKQPAWNDSYLARVRVVAKGLEYHELSGVNHCLMMDEPERFNALVREFVAKHKLMPTTPAK